MGRSAAFVRRLEAGVGHDNVTVGELTQLSLLLGVPTRDLLAAPDGSPDELASPAGWDDDMDLAAMIVDSQGGLPTAAVSAAMNLSASQIHEAVRRANLALAGNGLRISLVEDNLILRAARRPPPVVAAAIRDWRRRRPIPIDQARLLKRLLAGEHVIANPRGPRGLVVASMIATGLIEAPSGPWQRRQPLRLDADVAFGLLGEPSHVRT